MFKDKIIIVLKSGYEIRLRASDCKVDMSQGFIKPLAVKPNIKTIPMDYGEIVAIIIKYWWQRWDG
jgi:hypothetical protein